MFVTPFKADFSSLCGEKKKKKRQLLDFDADVLVGGDARVATMLMNYFLVTSVNLIFG